MLQPTLELTRILSDTPIDEGTNEKFRGDYAESTNIALWEAIVVEEEEGSVESEPRKFDPYQN